MSTISSARGGQMAPVAQHQGSVVKQEQKDSFNGEEKESVNVQSQVASAQVGTVKNQPITSNIDQILREVGTHNTNGANVGKVEQDLRQLSAWGNGEITSILTRTKTTEEGLVQQARAKQAAIEEQHKAALTKIVQEADLKKAAQLKELEDELQRNLQAELTRSKEQIGVIERQVKERQAGLLQQLSQLGGITSKLSELVVTANLAPSVTRTIIETNTQTGNVFAVAAGGEQSKINVTTERSGSTQVKEAVPVAGKLVADGVRIDGDLVDHASQRKVGEGQVVQTSTSVVGGSAASSSAGPGAQVIAEQQRMGGDRNKEPIAAKHIDAAYGRKI